MTSQQASPSKPPSSEVGGDTGNKPRHCAECGTRPTPGQSFCDGCGAVLSWTPDTREQGARTSGGPRDASAAGPDTPADADADAADAADSGSPYPVRAPAQDPLREPIPGPFHEPLREPAQGPFHEHTRADSPMPPDEDDDTLPTIPVTRAAPSAPPAAFPADAPAPPAAATPDSDASARARALLVPVAEQRAAAPAPDVAPVLPGMPAAARPRVQSPAGEPAEETGPPCPWCEVGNRPDRHFCRRCGMSLAERPGVPEARAPWWRRMWNFGDGPTPWAGERPRLRRGIGRIFSWIGYGLALGLVIYAAFNVGTAWNAARDHFSKRAQVTPDSYEASRSFGKHPPKLLFDKISNSWWGPGISGDANGEWVEARFAEPTRLLDILVTSGISTKASDLTEAALPRRMDAIVTTSDGKKATRQITLDQISGPQQRKFRAQNVVSVRFVLRSAYNVGSDKQVSMAEIEFFTRATTNGT
ncbi:NADase-type glycan-binding domain-containing protein [Streptomyces corynorhini]|uniref:Zinc ribbon domain-containing protein n=1 Tax=Streptomyces corynorhini TaxID=2282652 RepID=A0A370BGB1_9ACTN|nr:zinc ribbon domain-containing protein [Streptomyces corynorhini]RDG39314.1 zinc ribbon domain-containing protein [Streptomyces corynorhini]